MNEPTPTTTLNTVAQKPYSGLSIASLVCGIISIVLLGIFTAIPAVICGHMSLGQLKREPETYNKSSRGMAIAGLVSGYITIGLTILLVVIILIALLIAAASQAR